MILPALFKYDSKDQARMWSVRAEGVRVITRYGLRGGQQIEQVVTAKRKNLGKVNETTAQEQAVIEAEAKHRLQIERDDYNSDIDKAGLQFRPMLARDYLKVPHQVDWTQGVAQAKLDGLRLSFGPRLEYGEKLEFLSRRGEAWQLAHLLRACVTLRQEINEILYGETLDGKDLHCQMLDGEIYYHGWTLQQILSAARRNQAGTATLEYYLFDLYVEGLDFNSRHALLAQALDAVGPQFPQLKLVHCIPCYSERGLKQIHSHCIANGFEGVMLRHSHSAYAVGKRSGDLFKYKGNWLDTECQIIDVWPDKNGNAMLTCIFRETGREFECTPKRSHKERKAMLTENLVGQWVTVKYFALTPDGAPQFPVGLDIRRCDSNGQPLE